MNKNPYSELFGIMHGVAGAHETKQVCIGTVKQSPPALVVTYNGIDLNSDELYISEYLLTEYARTTRGHIVSATQNRAGGGGYAEFASHNHDINNDYTESIITTDTLVPGDKVAMLPVMPEGGKSQQYIVIDKIVRPDRRAF